MSDFLKELYEWSTGTLAPPISASANPPLAASATFYDYMPPTPEDCIAFFDTSGNANSTYPVEGQLVRVLARGANRDAAKVLADQVYNLFHLGAGSVLNGQTLDEFHVYTLIARSRPQQAGVDKNKRPLYAFDVEAKIREN